VASKRGVFEVSPPGDLRGPRGKWKKHPGASEKKQKLVPAPRGGGGISRFFDNKFKGNRGGGAGWAPRMARPALPKGPWFSFFRTQSPGEGPKPHAMNGRVKLKTQGRGPNSIPTRGPAKTGPTGQGAPPPPNRLEKQKRKKPRSKKKNPPATSGGPPDLSEVRPGEGPGLPKAFASKKPGPRWGLLHSVGGGRGGGGARGVGPTLRFYLGAGPPGGRRGGKGDGSGGCPPDHRNGFRSSPRPQNLPRGGFPVRASAGGGGGGPVGCSTRGVRGAGARPSGPSRGSGSKKNKTTRDGPHNGRRGAPQQGLILVVVVSGPGPKKNPWLGTSFFQRGNLRGGGGGGGGDVVIGDGGEGKQPPPTFSPGGPRRS